MGERHACECGLKCAPNQAKALRVRMHRSACRPRTTRRATRRVRVHSGARRRARGAADGRGGAPDAAQARAHVWLQVRSAVISSKGCAGCACLGQQRSAKTAGISRSSSQLSSWLQLPGPEALRLYCSQTWCACRSFGLYVARVPPAEERGHGPDAAPDQHTGLPSPDAHSPAARGGHLPDPGSDAAAHDAIPGVWACELHLMVTLLLISLLFHVLLLSSIADRVMTLSQLHKQTHAQRMFVSA